MKMGLAGIGVKDDWRVEIHELIDLDLCGIVIANRQFKLQVFEVPIDQIKKLLRFLKDSKQDECLDFRNVFGGKLELLNHDGAVFIRIRHDGEHCPNLVEIAVEHAECATLCAVLDEAITDAALPD